MWKTSTTESQFRYTLHNGSWFCCTIFFVPSLVQRKCVRCTLWGLKMPWPPPKVQPNRPRKSQPHNHPISLAFWPPTQPKMSWSDHPKKRASQFATTTMRRNAATQQNVQEKITCAEDSNTKPHMGHKRLSLTPTILRFTKASLN